MTGGEVEVVQTSYEVNMEDFEDIVYTHDEFDVRLVAVHDVTAFGEVHEYYWV